jgi:dTDP-4-amino-4,6-dideoxygalactose transaminase
MERAGIIQLFKPHLPENCSGLVGAVLQSGQIAGGPNVAAFETRLRDYLDNRLVTTTGDISTSLTICLLQTGVRPDDDVLMSPLVCLSSSCPVKNLFANIRWCDVDPMTGNLDPADLARKLTPRTKAIVVYHWAGNPAELDAIHAFAREHGLAVIEDAGEALGAQYHGKKIGAAGSDYTIFSFYPNRHITTIEGGAISCEREEDFEKIRWLKRYGIHQPSFRSEDGEINPASDIPVAGFNSYMNQVAATLGLAQMDHLDRIVARHQSNGIWYDKNLSGIHGIRILSRPVESLSAYWVYTFLADDRDKLAILLRQHGISASKVHIRNDLYSGFGSASGGLPGVDYFSDHCLSIPSGWWVTDEDRIRIADLISRAAE